MSCFLDALHGHNRGRPPIWLMRQAGRYMPKYQELKKNYSLNTLFSQTDLIVKISLLPIDLLDVDAAILFADILSVLEGFGKPWQMVEGIGPTLEKVVDVNTLQKKNAHEAYSHIKEAIIILKKTLKCPLIGFAGGPFTVGAYLIEGKLSKDLKEIKKWIYSQPDNLHLLLDKVADATIDYLTLQIEAGVDVIQLFDSWAGLLDPRAFKEFSLRYLEKVMQGIKHFNIPTLLFCRGSFLYAHDLASLNPSGISFDWQGQLNTLSLPSSIAIQGNLDPVILFGSQKYIKKEVDSLLSSMRGHPRYIFNLGHGILPETPFENVRFLVDHVKSFSP